MIDAVERVGGDGKVEELVEVGGAVVVVPDDPPTELMVPAAVCFVDDVVAAAVGLKSVSFQRI